MRSAGGLALCCLGGRKDEGGKREGGGTEGGGMEGERKDQEGCSIHVYIMYICNNNCGVKAVVFMYVYLESLIATNAGFSLVESWPIVK